MKKALKNLSGSLLGLIVVTILLDLTSGKPLTCEGFFGGSPNSCSFIWYFIFESNGFLILLIALNLLAVIILGILVISMPVQNQNNTK